MKISDLQVDQQISITLDETNGLCTFTVVTVEISNGHPHAMIQNDLYGAVWIDDSVGDITLAQ